MRWLKIKIYLKDSGELLDTWICVQRNVKCYPINFFSWGAIGINYYVSLKYKTRKTKKKYIYNQNKGDEIVLICYIYYEMSQ